jgi:ABC-type branched-subunit amino acid transport system ATPase component
MKGNHKNLFFILAVVLTLMVSIAASSAMAEPGITKDKIKIGTYMALTGPAAGTGKTLIAGIYTYINIINERVRINQDGTSILLVEQNARMALSIAHYGYVLEMGKIVFHGKSDDLCRDERVVQSYLGMT